MTKLLEQAFSVIGRMPPDAQDGIARALLAMGMSEEPDDVEPEHREAVMDGMAQAQRGEFSLASPAEALRSAFEIADR